MLFYPVFMDVKMGGVSTPIVHVLNETGHIIHIHVQEYFYMYFLITSWQSISKFLWLNSATWIRRHYLDIVETEPFNQCTADGSEIRRENPLRLVVYPMI